MPIKKNNNKQIATELDTINQGLADIANKQWNDFISASVLVPWIGVHLLSGTANGATGALKHPGTLMYSSSSSANSGYSVRQTANTIVLGGGEKSTAIIKTASTLMGVTRRIFFHDTIDATAPVDGVYTEIVDGVLSGKTSSNSTRTTTGTTYTLTADTWYRLKCEINKDATQATYTLYADDSATVLWTDTLSTNIPKTIGREVGHGDICTYSGSSAITIGYLDYIDIIIPNARRVS